MRRRSGGTEPDGDDRVWPSTEMVPAVGSMKPAIIRKRRGLAAARRPQQRDEFASLKLEVDIVDRDRIAEALGAGRGEQAWSFSFSAT